MISGLARIFHKISQKSDEMSCEIHRESAQDHYQIDKTRVFLEQNGVTDRSSWPRVCEKYGLEIRGLTYRIHKRALIEDISLQFKPGVLYGVLGPNGSGKSTFLKNLSRIWTPSAGTLLWQGEELLQFSRLEMSQTISLVPQNPQIYFDFDVYHMVAMGRYPHGERTTKSRLEVEKALHQVNGWHLRHQLISQLSGGERQRIYIARALATQAPILLLDEPTSHLDLRHQLEIWQLLRILLKEGKLIITAVHDLLAAQRFCDQLVILNAGKCRATGTYEEIMTPSLLREIFGVSHHDQTGAFELHSSN